MIQAYAVGDVRAVEAALMAHLAEGELMARAARGLADVVSDRLTERDGRRVVALVGGGNNGGDALYAVALLAQAGVAAGAVCTAYSSVHAGGREAALAAGVVVAAGGGSHWQALLAEADIVIDGITGIGGRPGLSDEAREWVAAIPESAYVVAVDLPSGVDPAGLVGTADCVFADETVTFGVAKPCHLLPASEAAVGRLTVVDIGLDFTGRAPVVERLAAPDVAAAWPVPTAASDKYSRGVLGVVAGSTAYPGAGILCVLGALGTGPGMVRYLGPAAVAALVHVHAPEAVTATGRVHAWVLGSGVDPEDTDDEDQVRWIRQALDSDLPCVVDAGGLAFLAPRSAPTLITPHAGELARLLTRLAGSGESEVTREDVLDRPGEHAQAAADALGAVVLLKGATTLIVSPTAAGRPVRSQADAPPWLATAGAGDVLAGILGTLVAAGLDLADAASVGAFVHGLAADRANPGGPVRALAVARRIPWIVSGVLAGLYTG